jgi:hydroxymethylglutaryl-CoA reductase
MEKEKFINGFSKLNRDQKLSWLQKSYGLSDLSEVAMQYLCKDEELQKLHDGFSENTITNYFMPYGIAPNFLIDGKIYAVPMVIEESSVVAAASSAAKFWSERGGFNTTIIDTIKVGHISFQFSGGIEELNQYKEEIFTDLKVHTSNLTANMEKRGGGLIKMEFIRIEELNDIFQLRAHFETCNSMGANFINTVLEAYASCLEIFFEREDIKSKYGTSQIILSILSNYTPECIVKSVVQCEIERLNISSSPADDIASLAYKFKKAVDIAVADVYRATTHNKGIYNGIDAVVLATGNDFRAIEAAGHAYASRDGKYRSLSKCTIEDGIFSFELEVPLALGTVGGLTALHPMAKKSLEILGNPSAEELMSIIASVGLAQNFAALRSLVTTGIQKGHMKMHLQNILSHLQVSDAERSMATMHFENKSISFSEARIYIEGLRNGR